MTELTSLAREELTRAGWLPGRCVAIANAVVELRVEGHAMSTEAEEFLTEFMDLEMKVRHVPSGMEIDSFDFSAVGASSIPAMNVALYEDCTGTSLTPIGFAFGGVMTLMLSASGVMYAAVDATLLKVGEGPIDGINALCENRELENIEGVDW